MKCEIIGGKLLCRIVCSDGTYEETEKWLQETSPSGTSANWCMPTKKQMAEHPNWSPVKCAEGKGTHYFFIC